MYLGFGKLLSSLYYSVSLAPRRRCMREPAGRRTHQSPIGRKLCNPAAASILYHISYHIHYTLYNIHYTCPVRTFKNNLHLDEAEFSCFEASQGLPLFLLPVVTVDTGEVDGGVGVGVVQVEVDLEVHAEEKLSTRCQHCSCAS